MRKKKNTSTSSVKRDGNANDADGYKYDLTQQIVQFQQNGSVNLSAGTVSNPQKDNTMQFDGCGNRTQLNGANESFNTMNQPADVPHDGDGNVQTYKGWTYSYDAQNRLKQATSGMLTEQFYYDGLNRQVARVTTGPAPSPVPSPTTTPVLPTPTVSPLPTTTPPPLNTPTVPPINTPTPPSGSPLGKCAPVTYAGQTGFRVAMSTQTSGATIFYTIDYSTPTHNGGTPTGTTRVYNAPVFVGACNQMFFTAIAYKVGMDDSDATTYLARNMSACSGQGGGGTSTIVISVWDGDWALLEEYSFNGTASTILQKYVEGYHGLVKTLVDNIYYYQDELGSTSHVADSSGNLLEYYRYDLYGTPSYFSSTSQQLTSSTYGVRDLGNGGGRWMSELGLYDDRNRFMSPDLGRFLQPDPIGFKGDSSNLYRYVGNDWTNRTDPMGLEDGDQIKSWHDPRVTTSPGGNGNPSAEQETERVQVTGSPPEASKVEPPSAHDLSIGMRNALQTQKSFDDIHVSLQNLPSRERESSPNEKMLTDALLGNNVCPDPCIVLSDPNTTTDYLFEGASLLTGGASGFLQWAASQATGLPVGIGMMKSGVAGAIKLGPSGKPMLHTPSFSTLKQARDAARNAGRGAPIKHANPRVGRPHFHATDRNGNKIPGVHYEYPGE